MNAAVRKVQTGRSGSALLVVLGFLSFMVVSAVAFSIYMRSERAPSSALRRSVATRHLVKAALAQAMSRVDDAIRADPFPGLPKTNNLAQCYKDTKNNPYNIWYGRVFMPPDPEGTTEPGQDVIDGLPATQFAPVTETVSVLNLEALGYLPPPLVNDVRFLSRSTWTAKWQNFMYDAGRFAFCAVNVSDYFDINKITAAPRSALPGGKISIGHLLRRQPDDLSSVDATAATQFKNFTGPRAAQRQTDSGVAATVPYVSLMDYNLALGSKYNGGIGNVIRSPFHWWLTQGTPRYFNFNDNGVPGNGGASRQVASQPFVTDSWSAPDPTTGGSGGGAGQQGIDIDISTLDGQPFPDLDMSGNATAAQVAQKTTFLTRLVSNGYFGEMDQFTFYDYLDHDDKPLMLAMPSVETVPMVAGVTAPVTMTFGVQAGPTVTIPPPAPGGPTTTTQMFNIQPGSLNVASINALIVFPFAHTGDRDVGKYSAQAMVKVFVAPKGTVNVRGGNLPTSLHSGLETTGNWNGQAVPPSGGALIWSACSMPQRLSFPVPSRPDDAGQVVSFQMPQMSSAAIPFFEKKTVTPANGPSTTTYTFQSAPVYEGTPEVVVGQAYTQLPASPTMYNVQAVVWIRITDGTQTYDLAPASIMDDSLNGGNNALSAAFAGFVGAGPSLLTFQEDAPGFTIANLEQQPPTGGAPVNWGTRQSLYVVDPRFNWAAEDWFEQATANVSMNAWLQVLENEGFFDNDHDPDIFMFTSDQGYLQSLGELAFLPRLRDRQNAGIVLVNPDNAPNKRPSRPQDTANAACAWRTHLVDQQLYQDLASIGIGRLDKNEWKVNPYSDNEEVLLAAFANTPADYWVTGRTAAGNTEGLSEEMKELVNELGDTSSTKIKTLEESLKYAFCEKNDESEQRLKTEKVVALANNVIQSMRAAAASGENISWETAFDNMFAADLDNLDPSNASSFENFLGVNTDIPLWSTDRKFLYSYWRDCFANKQQLFLIFVRAESSALGGSGEGTPSQQSGRAVALVWREPQSNTTDGGNGANDDKMVNYMPNRRPHRMRVLFYHQFD